MMPESIGIGSGILMLLSVPLNCYVIYTKLEKAEDYLKFSSFIVTFKYRFGVGALGGKFRRLFAIALVILMPSLFQWRHLVLVEDVKRIPTPCQWDWPTELFRIPDHQDLNGAAHVRNYPDGHRCGAGLST